MQYQPGFAVTYTNRDGRVFKAFVPPAWMKTGKERREDAEALRRKATQARNFARYWAAIRDRGVS
jgi:O-glycosyl hydrolase